ncbi:MAG: DNA cytosine methyltransferase [Parcubacteria group bacterium]|nr:DNA cytosine methyltransferase [Parcubacteria group bacterium]
MASKKTTDDSPKLPNVRVIDLFCGVGGMTHGFVRQGFSVVAGIDIDRTCRYAYETNNRTRFIEEDIANVTGEMLNRQFGGCDIRVLIGCAPCQPFSNLNTKKRVRSMKKKFPLEKFAELIAEIKPEIVSMENVKGLTQKGRSTVFRKFIRVLEENGYEIFYDIIDCSNYGVPQKRYRLILLASRLGKIKLMEPTHTNKKVTVRDVIGNLPPIEDGEVHPQDPLHRASKLSPLNKRRIVATPSDGGNSNAWPEKLKLECHKKETGRSYKGTVYGRMHWSQPSPTMTTQCYGLGNGRFGHPVQHRAISLREAALFQTFPRHYRFFPPNEEIHTKSIGRHIGNAVPVKIGEVIARSIKTHLEKSH